MDLMSYILAVKNAVRPTDEQVTNAVNEHLTAHPVTPGASEEEAAQIAQNVKDIAALETTTEQQTKDIAVLQTGKAKASGWSANKYLGTDASGNVVEKEAPVVSGGSTDSSENPTRGTGWTTEQVDLLDSLLSNISFNSENGGAIADMLIASLRSGASSGGGSGDSGGETEPDNPTVETYTITRYLTGCTSSSSLSSVVGGTAHSETLTAADGYAFDGATVSVTMDGEDITDTVYSDGVIDIASVTGNIVISVVAVNVGMPVYELAEATTFDSSTAAIDTGAVLFDMDKDWSIMFDFSVGTPAQITPFCVANPKNAYGNKALSLELYTTNSATTFVNGARVRYGSLVWLGEKSGNTAKGVITHTAGTDTVVTDVYQATIAGKTETLNNLTVTPGDGWPQTDQPVTIGGFGSGVITFNDFKVYKRVLAADEISAYLA